MGTVVQLAYRVQKFFWRLFRPHTRGVKVMLVNASGEILLIRNSYGATNFYVLPGGAVRPWERPIDTARREVGEDLSAVVEALAAVSTHCASSEGKRELVHLFEGTLVCVPQADGVEVAEASYFALDALPEMLSPATSRRLAERKGEVEPDGNW